MECYTYLRNVTDLFSDGKTPNERRFGQPFAGPIIPFGSLVEYHPVTAKDQSRIHQFGKTVLPGLFLGYAVYAGRIWKGDILVADIEELETMDASESTLKDLSMQRKQYSPKKMEIFLDTGTSNSRRRSRRFSCRIRRVSFTTYNSFPDADEVMKDFCSMSGNFMCHRHVEPSVKLYSPREESSPIQLKYNGVSRTTHTYLDVMQERRIDDIGTSMGKEICLILGKVSLSLLY